ncbi:MAG: PspA-associated protein PspAB [Nocardioidaceae bacterium]
MSFLDSLLGRGKAVKPNLDALFSVPQAALTLQASGGFTSSGAGSVCYRASEGTAFSSMQTDVEALLDADGGPKVERSEDSFGFTWLLCRHDPDDIEGLVTDLHAVNTTLEDNGFGSSLLCSLVGFTGPKGQQVGLVYLYKRGTFYPFAPLAGDKRDNAVELQVRGMIGDDVPIEKDLQRWMPVWGAPGLS